MIRLRRAPRAGNRRDRAPTVAGVLESLAKEGFRAVPDVPTAYGNLDHVVARHLATQPTA